MRGWGSAVPKPRRDVLQKPKPRSTGRCQATPSSVPPPRRPRPRSSRWRTTRRPATTGATSCAPWCDARWNSLSHERSFFRSSPRKRGPREANCERAILDSRLRGNERDFCMSARETKGSGMTWVGRAIRRLEDPALITGQGRFTADLPAVHWVRFVRSPNAAGKIVSIGVPDGAYVVTAADLKDVKTIVPMLHKFAYKPVAQPVLAEGVVRFVGEAVAAVVARSEEEAEDIADLVEIAVDETPPVIDARDALADGAPQVHAVAPGNVILEGKVKTPDFDTVWNAAAKIVTVEARSRRQNATPMEARGGHAAWDASTGRVTLTCTTQMPHLMRTAIADVLSMPESDLRVVAPDVGGGFGQKMSLCSEYVVLVWLARNLKSSVAWTEDRRENLIASFHARDQYQTLAGAFDAKGKLLALKADILSNVGAYSCFP